MARKKIPPFSLRRCQIGVIGLGYVGLPLAVEFGRLYETIGFDVRPERIQELARADYIPPLTIDWTKISHDSFHTAKIHKYAISRSRL